MLILGQDVWKVAWAPPQKDTWSLTTDYHCVIVPFSISTCSNSCVKGIAHNWFFSILTIFKMENSLDCRKYCYCTVLQKSKSCSKMLSFFSDVGLCPIAPWEWKSVSVYISIRKHGQRHKQAGCSSLYIRCLHFSAISEGHEQPANIQSPAHIYYSWRFPPRGSIRKCTHVSGFNMFSSPPPRRLRAQC